MRRYATLPPLESVLGYGSGSLRLVLPGEVAIRADIDMTKSAMGVRGPVLSASSGLELALRSDVLWVTTGSPDTLELGGTDGERAGCVWRWKAGVLLS